MWSPILTPGAVTLLSARGPNLRGFLQELCHFALHRGPGVVLWCDSDHGFDPYHFAELNLVRGHAADAHAERMLIRRCLTPFQWYTTLSRHILSDFAEAPTALAIASPFDRPWSTDELSDWEAEDYVRFILPHLAAAAKAHDVPLLLGVDMTRWWQSHPVLAQVTLEGVAARWSVASVGGRWRAQRDDGTVLDPALRDRTTLLDYLPREPPLAPLPTVRSGPGPLRRPESQDKRVSSVYPNGERRVSTSRARSRR